MKNVVIFSAKWCTYCTPVKAALGELKEEGLINLCIIDVDAESDCTIFNNVYTGVQVAMDQYGVRGLPTMVQLAEHGQYMGTKTGALSRVQIMDWLGF